MKVKAPKGTRDILPADIYKWQYTENLYKEICETYGYKEIRIPTFESTEVFARGVGDTTDIVQKEMYTFNDKGNRSITLRPEGTAGVARCYIENGMGSLPAPVKLFYNITAFRYENVQKGRFREFHQLGLEAFGSKGPQIDAEIISLLYLFLKKLNIKSTGLKINSIGCPVCRKDYNEKLKDYLRPNLNSMCNQCNERFDKNPLRIIDCKEENCKRVTKDAPALADNLCDECKVHFDSLCDELEILAIPFEIDKTIVRGLDYYTKTVFEFVSKNVGTQGTICGGGRYDGLISQFGSQNTPGIGFALGLERLFLEMDAQGITPTENEKESIYFAFADSDGENMLRKACYTLREKGVISEIDVMGRSLKSQMKFAAKLNYTYICVAGNDETISKVLTFRNLKSREEFKIAEDKLEQIKYDGNGGILWHNLLQD